MMVTLTISANFTNVQKKLDEMQRDVATKALARALNRTTDLGKTEMSKRIREEFNLSASKVKEKLFIKRATFSQGRFGLSATLQSYGPGGRRAINIINFQANSTRRGLTAKIKKNGGRVLVAKRGFIGNGGRTAFVRVGSARLPIRALQTIDVPQMFNTKRINSKVRTYMLKRFPEVFAREAAFYTKRFNGG